jgi:hypothetical protein
MRPWSYVVARSAAACLRTIAAAPTWLLGPPYGGECRGAGTRRSWAPLWNHRKVERTLGFERRSCRWVRLIDGEEGRLLVWGRTGACIECVLSSEQSGRIWVALRLSPVCDDVATLVVFGRRSLTPFWAPARAPEEGLRQ